MQDILNLKELLSGKMTGSVSRFVKQVGRTINKYSMIKADDDVIIGVSGGKDSLVLSLALSLRLKWLPIKYNLVPIMINWKEHPMDEKKLDDIKNYFSLLGLELRVVDEDMYSDGFKGEFNCYLCSRNRRRVLFDIASRENIHTIALGHHLDDIVETCIINTAFRGHFESMQPVQEFFSGKLKIIRPMAQVHERAIMRIAENYALPVSKPVCPHERENIRVHIKPIVSSLAHIDKLSREHIYSALFENKNTDKEC